MKCWNCKKEEEVEAYLDGVTAWWPWIEALQHECKACGHKEELQFEPGKILLGYIYAAGTAHFAAMEEIAAPGLMINRGSAALEVGFNGRFWSIPSKT